MNRLFPIPTIVFLKLVFKNGGVAPRRIAKLALWVFKTLLLEPFRWLELALYAKKINRYTIADHPVFVLGFHRSGTTYLHQLFTKDDRLGYHSNFHMIFPEIMLIGEKILVPVLEFFCRIFKLQDAVHRVPLSFRYPGEEDAAMTTSPAPGSVQWGFVFPKMMRDVFNNYVLFENKPEADINAFKKDFVDVLKKTSMANKGKRLVLKSPPNTARIKYLLSVFPNAKFVFIHRDPYETYLSNKQFWKVLQNKYALGSASEAEIKTIILDTYSQMTNRYLLEKHLIPEGQLAEIAYDDLIQNPLESMRKLYETIHLENFGYCENDVRALVESQQSYVRLKHEIPAEEREAVAQRMEHFIKTWNYGR
ncbi:MAG: sulfotransferase [Saprospiraceae bacterium]|nr:sulfotransferase [Saprospiraceae bacterium]